MDSAAFSIWKKRVFNPRQSFVFERARVRAYALVPLLSLEIDVLGES